MAISKRDLIFDSLILLPSLGFPAIAEFNEAKGKYEIFASMLVITPCASFDIREQLSSILAIEEFKSHLDGRLPSFSEVRNNWRITSQAIRRLPTPSAKNKVFWLSQPDFTQNIKSKFLEAYRKKRGVMAQNDIEVKHIEFLLALPFDQSSPNIQGRLFNLVCKHERTKSRFQRILSNIKPEDDVPYKSSIITKIGNKPIIPYHPIYIPPEKDYLNIAHISDTHVSRRWDAMEYWAKKRDEEAQNTKDNFFEDLEFGLSISKSKCFPDRSKTPWSDFNNPNRNFEEALKKANENSEVDIIIISGDLIDYNLGYCGDVKNKQAYFNHGIKSYYYNYNWPLFYEILLKNYEKPVFTILGNHDYRFGPYGIVTEGKWRLKYRPMPVHAPWFSTSYIQPIDVEISPLGAQNYADDLGTKVKNDKIDCQKKAINFIYSKKMTEFYKIGIVELKTDYKYVEWYNLVINPALDYKFSYKNMHFLFFDWHKDEKIWSFLEIFGNPWAENVLTPDQKKLIVETIEALNRTDNNGAKILIISMHPTVFCEPHTKYTDGIIVDDESRDDDEPKHLALGNFEKGRLWFIQRLYEFSKSGGVSIVLSGHAHKNRIYAIEGCKKGNSVRNINGDELKKAQKRSPLFIVTTSSAYISKEKATPGFRNLKFVNGAIYTELVTIKKI